MSIQKLEYSKDAAVIEAPREAPDGPARQAAAEAGRTADPDAGADDAVYASYSRGRRAIALGVVAATSVVMPLADTLYLPAMGHISRDLGADPKVIVTSVSFYMLAAGAAVLLWGPLGDRVGRKKAYAAALGGFVAASVACALAPNAVALIVFRMVQGACGGAFTPLGLAVVADVFPPRQRGAATGAFMVPMLVGPVVGPMIGGAMSDTVGWRATFFMVAALAVLMLAAIAALLPETLQHVRRTRLAAAAAAAAAAAGQAASPHLSSRAAATAAEPPVSPFAPLAALRLMYAADVAPHAIANSISFAAMFVTFVELPSILAAAPYQLSASSIGLAFIAAGVGAIGGSPLGGVLSDAVGRRFPRAPVARALASTAGCALLLPPALLAYGWSASAPAGGGGAAGLAVLLAAHFAVTAVESAYFPGVTSWLSIAKQDQASSAAAGLNATVCATAAVFVQAVPFAIEALGYGWLFTLLAALQLLACAGAVHSARRGLKEADNPLCAVQAGGGAAASPSWLAGNEKTVEVVVDATAAAAAAGKAV